MEDFVTVDRNKTPEKMKGIDLVFNYSLNS
jgi:hypothetical protein